MVILDAPYVSDILLGWLAESAQPVLANDFTREAARTWDLNLIDESEAARRVNAGERVYTNSENALAWLLENTENDVQNNAIRLFKDKAAMREKLASLSPELFFATYDRSELEDVNAEDLPLPVVLKPAVGFCSMGVYVIEEPSDWHNALDDIAAHENDWNARYPESVVDGGIYLVESYLDGQEYAIDMYYDGEGKAQILNILRHDFASPDDTSDRLYLTNSTIINEMQKPFETWLNAVNEVVGARDFPIHVEVRVQGDSIVPIEFNPLRFAGLGGTDVAYYGVGLRTYQAYLEDVPVNLNELYAADSEGTFIMSLLNPHPTADLSRPFDYDALASRFSRVLGFNLFDVNAIGSYGFLFLRTDDSSKDELDYLLHDDLLEFQL